MCHYTPRRMAERLSLDLQSVTETGAAYHSLQREDFTPAYSQMYGCRNSRDRHEAERIVRFLASRFRPYHRHGLRLSRLATAQHTLSAQTMYGPDCGLLILMGDGMRMV